MTPYEQEKLDQAIAVVSETSREFTDRLVVFANAVAPVMAQAATTLTAAWDEFARAVIAEHPEVADANGNLRDDWLDILRAKQESV